MRRIVHAFSYSLSGLAAALRHEAAFRQELALALVLLAILPFVELSTGERLLLALSLLLVLVVELLNSAIEAVVDVASPEHHSLARRAKDMGSAAVLLTLLGVGGLWCYLLGKGFGYWA